MPKKDCLALIILDGFGHRETYDFNAIAQASMPHFNSWMKHYPHTFLQASGTSVGLPNNACGNSEVGHQTIGAGRTIQQSVNIIHNAIEHNTLAQNQILIKALKELAHNKGRLHIIGLLSDANVHSHQELLYALLDIALQYHIKHIYIHPILDGRDVPPASARHYLEQLETYIKDKPLISIGSIHGRYYAMDRDNNWDRTEKSVTCLTQKEVTQWSSWRTLIDHWYDQKVTDEFIPPTNLDPEARMQSDDGIIFFNFRPDRARQLTEAILKREKNKLAFFITPVSYDDPQHQTTTLFTRPIVTNTLSDQLHRYNKHLFAIAETEKYAHVTYFFTSGREQPLNNETYILIPSLKKESYINNPEMSAQQITQTILYSLQHNPQDFYLINYANADMVGHSGNLQATIQAVECLDKQLAQLYEQIVEKMNGTMIVTADHGKAEEMFDVTHNQPRTAHTTNKVPFLVLNKTLKGNNQQLPLKTIADIAPFVLNLMNLPVPEEMVPTK